MNIILFSQDELDNGLSRGDRRVDHILNVLRFTTGDWFDAGILNGTRGKARMASMNQEWVRFDWKPGDLPLPPYPITVLLGMPRPQTARRILRELTALGVAAIWFAQSDRSEAGYGTSKLWTTGEWERHLVTGAEQAFCTHIPTVERYDSIEQTVAVIESGTLCLALDNYEFKGSLARVDVGERNIVLAIGAERGWSSRERDILRSARFQLVSLGPRVLRVETAAIAAVSILASGLDR